MSACRPGGAIGFAGGAAAAVPAGPKGGAAGGTTVVGAAAFIISCATRFVYSEDCAKRKQTEAAQRMRGKRMERIQQVTD